MSQDRARVHLTGGDARSLRRAAYALGVDLCYGSGRTEGGAFSIDGLLSPGAVEEATARLAEAGVTLTVVGSLSVAPPPLSPGDRFARRGAAPQGLGEKE